MPIQKINHIDIYFEQHGQGDDVILIGGLGADHQVWKSSLRLFSQHFRVLIFDNRGAGKSSAPPAPYSLSTMTNDVIGLMHYLNIKKAHIVGHSMGGCIAQYIGIYHPEILNKLVLVASRGKPSALSKMLLEMKAKLQRAGVSDVLLAEYVMPFLFSEYFLKNKSNVTGFIHWTLKNTHPQSLTSYENQLHAVSPHDTFEKLHHISAPTLIIAGEEDILMPEKEAREMAAIIPHATLKIIPQCAHMPHVEQAALFSQIVLEFFMKAR